MVVVVGRVTVGWFGYVARHGGEHCTYVSLSYIPKQERNTPYENSMALHLTVCIWLQRIHAMVLEVY